MCDGGLTAARARERSRNDPQTWLRFAIPGSKLSDFEEIAPMTKGLAN